MEYVLDPCHAIAPLGARRPCELVSCIPPRLLCALPSLFSHLTGLCSPKQKNRRGWRNWWARLKSRLHCWRVGSSCNLGSTPQHPPPWTRRRKPPKKGLGSIRESTSYASVGLHHQVSRVFSCLVCPCLRLLLCLLFPSLSSLSRCPLVFPFLSLFPFPSSVALSRIQDHSIKPATWAATNERFGGETKRNRENKCRQETTRTRTIQNKYKAGRLFF